MRFIRLGGAIALVAAAMSTMGAVPSRADESHIVLCREDITVAERRGQCREKGVIGGGNSVRMEAKGGEAPKIEFIGGSSAVPRIACKTSTLTLSPTGGGVGNSELVVGLAATFADCKSEEAKDPMTGAEAEQTCNIVPPKAERVQRPPEARLRHAKGIGDGKLKGLNLRLRIVCAPNAGRPLLNCIYEVAPKATFEFDGAREPSLAPKKIKAKQGNRKKSRKSVQLRVAKDVNDTKADCGSGQGAWLSVTYRSGSPAWRVYVIKCGNRIIDPRLLLAPCEKLRSAWLSPSA